MVVARKPHRERILESVVVDPESGCWLWQKILRSGYGQMWVGSRTDGTRRKDRRSPRELRRRPASTPGT